MIKNWSAMEASFVDCTFSGKLRSVMFWGAHLERDFPAGYGRIEAGPNEFRGNDFSRCDLQDVSFEHGIDLGAQSLPVGEKYLVIEDGVEVLGRFLEDVGLDALPKRQRIALEVARDSLVSRNQRQAFMIKDRELGPIWDDLRAFCSADAPAAGGAPTSSAPEQGTSPDCWVAWGSAGVDGFVFVQSESGASFEEVTEALADHVVDSDDDVLWVEVDGQRASLIVEGPEELTLMGPCPQLVADLVRGIMGREGWVEAPQV